MSFPSEFLPCAQPATASLTATGTYDGTDIAAWAVEESLEQSITVQVTPLGWSQTVQLAGVEVTITGMASAGALGLNIEVDVCSTTDIQSFGGKICGSDLLSELPFTILDEELDISEAGICPPPTAAPTEAPTAAAAGDAADEGGSDVGMIIGIIAGVLVIGGGGAFFMMKKKQGA